MIADNNLGSDSTSGGFHCDTYGGIVRTGDAIAKGDASDFHGPLADRWLQRAPWPT